MSLLEPPALACLERTRSAVLSVVMTVAVGIAASGLILRWRDRGALWRAPESVRQSLLAALLLVAVSSYATRRIGGSRGALRDPSGRAARFYRIHVLSAVLASLAVPLGLAYGWLIRPRLDAVCPFWVASLALGLLSLPRASELEDFDEPLPDSSEKPA